MNRAELWLALAAFLSGIMVSIVLMVSGGLYEAFLRIVCSAL
jgi:hypothetical protein